MNGGVSRRSLRSLPGPPEHWEFTRWSAEFIDADQFGISALLSRRETSGDLRGRPVRRVMEDGGDLLEFNA